MAYNVCEAAVNRLNEKKQERFQARLWEECISMDICPKCGLDLTDKNTDKYSRKVCGKCGTMKETAVVKEVIG
jgi:ribosomal protein S27AE